MATSEKIRAVTANMGRVGSTMLGMSLNAHPQVQWKCELNNAWLHPAFEAARGKDPEVQLAKLQEMGWSTEALSDEQKVIGFKLRFDLSDAAQAIATQEDVRVIVLRRENLLKQVASERIGMALRYWAVTQKRDERVLLHFTMDPEVLREAFEAIERRYQWARETLAGNPHMEVTYEQLTGRHAEAHWRRVTDFLEVDPVPWDPPTFKQESRPMWEVFVNYDELAAAFEGTRWAWMFAKGKHIPGRGRR